MRPESDRPAVTVGLPVLDEERHLRACLEAIAAQRYPSILEIVVADGGSTDGTRAIAADFGNVRVVDNPRRSRPAGLNVAIEAARGEIFVRVDARTVIEPDYVGRCVEDLESTGAAMVGGPMRFSAAGAAQRGVRAAMMSRLGAGPAAFRREGGSPRFVDTVYLGAYRVETIRALGGYDEHSGGNEDAELAFRAQSEGGVYLDPAIRSAYSVREGLGPLGRQFYRYGRNRARTTKKHPQSLSVRQLAVPALLLGVASPLRRPVLTAYVALVGARVAVEAVRDPAAAPTFAAALPVMHLSWGAGWLRVMASWPLEALRAASSRRGSGS